MGIETTKIKRILYGDLWNKKDDLRQGNISIEITPYIEIEFKKRINYTEIHKYIYELEIYLQLYLMGSFKVDNVWTKVGDIYYVFNCNVRKFDYRNNSVIASVDDDLSSFLRKCYQTIDYACTTKTWLRNIPYIIGIQSRNIEDAFLPCIIDFTGKTKDDILRFPICVGYDVLKLKGGKLQA